jgi:hypothetical protein
MARPGTTRARVGKALAPAAKEVKAKCTQEDYHCLAATSAAIIPEIHQIGHEKEY